MRKDQVVLSCRVCGRSFSVRRSYSWIAYCSKMCRSVGKQGPRKKRVAITCETCGAQKLLLPGIIRCDPSRFCSNHCRAIWQLRTQRTKDTKIEQRMAALLNMLGVKYEAQKPFPGIGIIDFYLPEQHIAVEVDGTYWHEREEVKRSDAKKDQSLKARGIEVIRVPGADLDPREGRTPMQRELKLAGGR